MIQICGFAMGNKEESFVFDDFTSGINIIHSNDNNKGKTIVSQGIFYALGNTPIFPAGFQCYNDYYYIVNMLVNDMNIHICRKNNFFLVFDGVLKSYDSVNDFKRYFSQNITRLPILVKNGIEQVAGLELFFEFVFLPQDKRTSSNICNRGRYNKDDYIDFIYSYMNCTNHIDPAKLDEYNVEIKRLIENRKILKKSSTLLKSKNLEASFITYTASKTRIDEKLKKVEKQKNILSNLINTKNKLLSKMTKNELLLKELNSLNRELETGKLLCVNCGSNKIVYEPNESSIKFEITDLDTRCLIKNIITERIQIAKEDVMDLDSKIVKEQKVLTELMSDDDISIENLIFYKNDIKEAASIDSEIYEIDQKISKLKTKIDEADKCFKEETKSKEEIYKEFVEMMNYFYSGSEPDDPLDIFDIFTKNNINYSGSQGALFLISKIYSASKVLHLDFPVYIDHFRGGEISSLKEENIIRLFKELNKQVIFSCTLKDEEINKYDSIDDIHSISFDEYSKFKILNSSYNEEFKKYLSMFNINLDI